MPGKFFRSLTLLDRSYEWISPSHARTEMLQLSRGILSIYSLGLRPGTRQSKLGMAARIRIVRHVDARASTRSFRHSTAVSLSKDLEPIMSEYTCLSITVSGKMMEGGKISVESYRRSERGHIEAKQGGFRPKPTRG
jgi:hypothetical protein